MTLKKLLIAAAAVATLAAPAVASAYPGYFHERWEGRGYYHPIRAWGYGYRPHCWIAPRGHFDPWGRWVVRPVEVCR